MPLIDLTHTSHTRARTGIQRVSRSLWREWGSRAEAVCFDPYLRGWRGLEAWELSNLTADEGAESRGARWPLTAKIRGRLRRFVGRAGLMQGVRLPVVKSDFTTGSLTPSGLVVPEIFSPAVAAALPDIFKQTRGPRVALFHDAIALQLPELTPAKSVARFPAYLRELLSFDGIAAISEDSRRVLLEHWEKIGARDRPPVAVIPLGVDAPQDVAEFVRIRPNSYEFGYTHEIGYDDPIVLCVGSIEGRKNHLALLEACEALWSRGLRFQLHLIGLARPETAQAALDRIAAFAQAGRSVRYEGQASDAALDAAYRSAAFTVYPSLLEGFGLPVIESLSRGKPCVCSARGALGESARGGGCLALESVDSNSLAEAVGRLLGDPTLLSRLRVEAKERRFKTWSDYARELEDWMMTLK